MTQPIRMCISCRERLFQKELFRYQCKNSTTLLEFQNGSGRSFYLCNSCSTKNNTLRRVSKICKNRNSNLEVLLKRIEENANCQIR
jgi:predicted RNA-binding protein YlxR (DUF448 family)